MNAMPLCVAWHIYFEKEKFMKKKKTKGQRLPVGFICLCVLPAFILTLFFTIIPTIRALLLSLTNATSLGLNNKFVFLENYIYMFKDQYFILALKNTLKLMAVLPAVTIAFSLILSFIISQSQLKER